MDEIHRICVENGLQYYMIGGTLLGSVRHKGFIPWDNDIDIAMPRNDYKRLKALCETELNSRFCCRDFDNTKNFDRPHMLICIRNTKLYTLYSAYNPKAENLGVYLDVFPLDNAPDSPKDQRRQANRLARIKWFKYYRIPYTYTPSKWKNALRACFRLAFFWISVDRVNRLQQREMMRYSNSETKNLCSMASHYSYFKQCMPKEIYGEPQLMEFDGREYYGPAQPDAYLTRIYGDYMKMPPESEQHANLEAFTSVEMDCK